MHATTMKKREMNVARWVILVLTVHWQWEDVGKRREKHNKHQEMRVNNITLLIVRYQVSLASMKLRCITF
jgi:hypothetical protein